MPSLKVTTVTVIRGQLSIRQLATPESQVRTDELNQARERKRSGVSHLRSCEACSDEADESGNKLLQKKKCVDCRHIDTLLQKQMEELQARHAAEIVEAQKRSNQQVC
jgi:hypothetical protein